MILPALSDLHHLLPGHDVAMPLPEVAHVVLLQPGGGGENHIRQFRRRREKEIDHRQELELLQGLTHLSRVGPRHHGVRPAQQPGHDGVGLTRQDSIPNHFGSDQSHS